MSVRSVRQLVTHHVDLCVGVPHVADNAAVLHAVEVLSHHHVLIAWWRHHRKKRKGKNGEKAVSRQIISNGWKENVAALFLCLTLNRICIARDRICHYFSQTRLLTTLPFITSHAVQLINCYSLPWIYLYLLQVRSNLHLMMTLQLNYWKFKEIFQRFNEQYF